MLQKLLFLMIVVFSNAVHAEQISAWDLSNKAGNEIFVSATSATNVMGLNLSRGTGLSAAAGADAFNAKGWNNFEATDYFSLGFTVGAAYKVSLSDLKFGLRASNTGPSTLGLFYSGDSFSSQLATFSLLNDKVHYQNVDLSFLTPLTGNVEFRIASQSSNMLAVSGGAVSTAGTLRLVNDAGLSKVQFNGAVAAVPEPETYAMFLVGLGLLALVTRRKNIA